MSDDPVDADSAAGTGVAAENLERAAGVGHSVADPRYAAHDG